MGDVQRDVQRDVIVSQQCVMRRQATEGYDLLVGETGNLIRKVSIFTGCQSKA